MQNTESKSTSGPGRQINQTFLHSKDQIQILEYFKRNKELEFLNETVQLLLWEKDQR